MASGLVYLIHYPDGSDQEPSVHTVVGAYRQVGQEILPGWIVFRILRSLQTIEGQAVQYEAWVVPRFDDPEVWRENPSTA
jgi:hypothetical protein